MKKLGLLVMPLTAISLLASCGSKPVDPSKIDLYKKEIMYDETGKNILYVTEREYNGQHLIKKETTTSLEYPGMKDVYEYTYDRHENEIELHLTSYNNEEKTDEGWTISEYTYDKQNRVTKQVTKMSFDNEDWTVFESYEYEYQENVTIEKYYYGDGSLRDTTTYTYDKEGNLINKKVSNPSYTIEYVYTVDENRCTKKIEKYYILESEEKKVLTNVTELTYLNNLWYRPLKETSSFYEGEYISACSTTEREYDTKNRIKLYKSYNGTEEGSSPYYYFYFAYEY